VHGRRGLADAGRPVGAPLVVAGNAGFPATSPPDPGSVVDGQRYTVVHDVTARPLPAWLAGLLALAAAGRRGESRMVAA
jgi:hypothetical protein